MSQSEKPSLSPVQEEAPTLDEARVTQVVAFLGDQRKTQSNMKFQLSNGDAEQLRLLAAALPGLLEASRLAESWKENYYAISDSLIKVKTQLSVSIRERETLTAERDAWEEYASHQEWCRSCAEEGTENCSNGGPLKEKAEALRAARQERP